MITHVYIKRFCSAVYVKLFQNSNSMNLRFTSNFRIIGEKKQLEFNKKKYNPMELQLRIIYLIWNIHQNCSFTYCAHVCVPFISMYSTSLSDSGLFSVYMIICGKIGLSKLFVLIILIQKGIPDINFIV